MSSPPPSGRGPCLLTPIVSLLAAGALSCAGHLGMEEPRPDHSAGGDGAPPPAVEAEPSVSLLRCGYGARGGTRYLSTDPTGIKLRPELERSVISLLSRGSRAATGSAMGDRSDRGAAPLRGPESRRSWQIVVASPPAPASTVTVEGPGAGESLRIEISGEGASAVVARAPALLAELRAISLDRLLDDMAPPREPLDWQWPALAAFLDLDLAALPVAGPHRPTPPALARRLLERLDAPRAPAGLAEALVTRVARLDPDALEPYRGGPRLGPRVLSLTRAALGGEKSALTELLFLALEYHGESELFDRALRVLFPPETHPDLHRLHPPDSVAGRLGFIAAVRRGWDGARFSPSGGWRLPEEGS